MARQKMSRTSLKSSRAKIVLSLFVVLCASTPILAAMPADQSPSHPPITIAQTKDGFTANIGNEVLHLTVCGDSVIHVVAGPGAVPANGSKQPWMLPAKESCPGATFQFAQIPEKAVLTTATLRIAFSTVQGNLTYTAIKKGELLREYNQIPRTYEPDVVNGQQTYHVTDRFHLDADDAYYGLGQHQSGMFNYRGSTVELGQNNTDIAIPFLVSSKGYALLWNTASFSYADNRFPSVLNLYSLAGNTVDYFFIYGPEMDDIIHQYRSMTGHTPMLPKWAYGFFQSKDRYRSQQEILSIAQRYREQHIPMDAIVQDWFWWKVMGDPEFNSNYTDVPAELKTLHAEHVHTMISAWALFDPKSKNSSLLKANHLDIADADVYDASNPKASDFYWQHLTGKLFAQGWDAFWLDSSEPEEYWPHSGDAILRDKQLAIGNGAEYTNIFPLLHSMGVQQHWKATTDRKRVFILTRSAFLGQQRVGAAVWSGDITGNYWTLGRQIPAGLNIALSGYPYWTTDVGGYWQPDGRLPNDPEYQELYTRWFEYGVFCPIFRTHGHRPNNEIWTYDKVEPILIRYDKLRYRLMPYIYSLAWRVHNADYTIQRPLVMDWRKDPETWNIGDQFMFGPAILVNPVLKKNALTRSLYLPDAPLWYDFWTGASTKGGKTIQAEAPLDRIPLLVRAGSILPMGPEIEYADQNPDGSIELRIYPGADGNFDLYEDEGDNYDYEKGMHATIPIHWSDAEKSLTIGDRLGKYPGMPEKRTFDIVWVAPNHGVGEAVESRPDRVIDYKGSSISIKMP
jgi:alpha-D-xyloside xylohydrolase